MHRQQGVMTMNILYLDISRLFFSRRHFESNSEALAAHQKMKFSRGKQYLESVPYDSDGAKAVFEWCQQNDYRIYPFGGPFLLQDLLEAGVIPQALMAPEINWVGRLRPDDNHPIRRLLAHFHAVEGDKWLAVGDFLPEEIEDFQDALIQIDLKAGIDVTLIDLISRLARK
ncbi:hypothetical protein [Vibrio mediterranei]|uniref:hypothetical protein n=1 Tax=Vibrio mediterranei TaxID=689 RepID=UPI004068EF63